MGMRIESVKSELGGLEIKSTGASVALDDQGVLEIEQRLGCRRKLLSCQLPKHLMPFRISKQTPFSVVLKGNGLTLKVQGDSCVILAPQQSLRLLFSFHFRPGYSQEVRGNRLLLDKYGGCGFFGIPCRPTELSTTESGEPALLVHIARWDELWLSISPPRERNMERYYESVAHEGTSQEPYPSNEIINGDGGHCNVFTVHEAWAADEPEWAENPPGASYPHPRPWETDHPVPRDADEFARVRDLAHRLGMKFVVYFSPYYSNAPDLFHEMKRILSELGVDGLYFDGWCGHREDFRPAYYMVRQARAILGERLLYVHSSTEPYGTCRVYLPFVFAYADYVLSGEAGRDGLERDAFLRYSVSQYQISNSVGLWCHYGSMGLPGYHAVVPKADDIKAALISHARIWRTAQSWSKGNQPEELERFDREYYSSLISMKEEGYDERP